MLPGVCRPVAIDTLFAQGNTSTFSQIVDTTPFARFLHDGIVVTAWTTNFIQMRLDQLGSLAKEGGDLRQAQLLQAALGLFDVAGMTEIEEVPADVVEREAD